MREKFRREKFRLGRWQVDPLAGTVKSAAGGTRRLRGKALSTLLALIEADGRTVTKDELLRAVWGDRNVTENSLNQAISEIRGILDDDRRNPRYVHTVHGQGYRLCVDPHTSTSSIRRVRPMAAAAAAAAFIALGLLIAGDKHGERLAAAASPDGRSVAYFAERNGISTLYVMDGQTSLPMPVVDIGRPDRHALSWSADGAFLVYNATAPDKPFYAINVVRPNGEDAFYIKFAKDPARHATDSVPADLTTDTVTVEHEEWARGKHRVHRVDLFGETLNIVFEGDRIASFSWSDRPFG